MPRPNLNISRLNPLAKIGLWGLAIVVIVGVVQASLGGLGVGYDSGTVVIVAALLTLLGLMAIDRRPIGDYGLVVGAGWQRAYLAGFAAGAGIVVAYLCLAVAGGALTIDADGITIARGATGLLVALTALPLAVAQQVIVSGYLVSTLGDRYAWPVAVIAAAALFAVLGQVDDLTAIAEPRNRQMAAALFLAAALLAIIRLLTGSIVVPAGAMAGWIFVSRFAGKLRLLQVNSEASATQWLAPGGDIRRAPLMIACLALATIVAALVLFRRGAARAPAEQPALDAAFKRVAPFTVPMQLAPIDVWLGRLAAERFRIGRDYLVRFAAVLLVSCVTTVLTLPERLLTALLLRRRRRPTPVFIVGVQRSGTTHLHRLLALDDQFSTARVYQAMNPVGHLFSGWLLLPFLAVLMPSRRPVDAMSFGILMPEEEEYAVAGVSACSPLWGIVFPQSADRYDRYAFPDRLAETDRTAWEKAYLRVVKMIGFWHPSRLLLLKNPFNTGRVAALHRLFPNARFIHISRHPHAVYRSNLHLAREGHVLLQLQDPVGGRGYGDRFLDYYRAVETVCWEDARQLPPGAFAHVRFEDLERDPVAVIEAIYADLGLDLSPRFRDRLLAYLKGLADYPKNVHRPLASADRDRIDAAMAPLTRAWGYPLTEPLSDRVEGGG